MIQPDGVRVKIPASTANLGPGFDTLGMALSLYAWIEMKEAEQTVFHLYGDEMQGIPGIKAIFCIKSRSRCSSGREFKSPNSKYPCFPTSP